MKDVDKVDLTEIPACKSLCFLRTALELQRASSFMIFLMLEDYSKFWLGQIVLSDSCGKVKTEDVFRVLMSFFFFQNIPMKSHL